MGDLVVLPDRVEEMLTRICSEKKVEPLDAVARRKLLEVGEEKAMDIVCLIYDSRKPLWTNISRYVTWYACSPKSPIAQASSSPASPTPAPATSPILSNYSPMKLALHDAASSSPPPTDGSPRTDGLKPYTSPLTASSLIARSKRVFQKPSFSTDSESNHSAIPPKISNQTLVLFRELEFRRFFLLRSYTGRKELEDVISLDKAHDIAKMKDLPMHVFESNIWEICGKEFCTPLQRVKFADWDTGKSHFYYCHLYNDGSYELQGPCLNTTRTHLQRSLGDENVLIIKFVDEDRSYIERILREGIIVGLWHYHFFVFKDESRDGKKKKMGEIKIATDGASAKCYFVRFDSIAECGDHASYALSSLKVKEARCLFMHVHMVSSIAKYMIRFSLILSKTIKLPIDMTSVKIKRIQDKKCCDENGADVLDEDGEARILTDGTGFISEDLALKCPENFGRAKYIDDKNFQKFCNFLGNAPMPFEGCGAEDQNKDPVHALFHHLPSIASINPLLMQVRLFSKGCAVKGTLVVNKKLKPGRIQIRPSMLKVERDVTLSMDGRFDSLEIVAVSNRPRKTYLSKYLIALLSYGGVPQWVFLDMLYTVLEETKAVFSNKRAAVNVAMYNEDIDDAAAAIRMIFAGFPLNEPYLQQRLYEMAKSARNGLKGGKIPISESCYLMGTSDPTGVLNRNEVCVVLDDGQMSGDVLVYRNPGLHFGDIHVLKAVYVKELESIIGNAKYGIFFSTKGHRSVAAEIANGDFDGDMYWVSRNPQLLKYFHASSPWNRVHSSPSALNKKPADLSSQELHNELLRLFLECRKPSFSAGIAADSWLAFMDRLLVLGDDCAEEKEALKKSMLQLIDLYYDAVDAPKSGKKIFIPNNLKAKMFPHHMEKKPKLYKSTSILGEIYDQVEAFGSVDQCAGDVWKLPCFNVDIQQKYVSMWMIRYHEYLRDMAAAMRRNDKDSKNKAAGEVIKKYKQLLYEAADFEESKKDVQEIYQEALAIYRLAYNYAIETKDVGKCRFAWRVAGEALLNLYVGSNTEKPITVLPSVLREVMF